MRTGDTIKHGSSTSDGPSPMAAQRSPQPLPLGSIIHALTGQKEAGPGAPWPVWRNSV